ncbi:uncharacterized protein SRS1_14797 [Sporisorium reilianum f. sp. reilianum]|uniref:Uncharacterized protein n=1 Tax=Sporisorium reilianum f. sp. reilianum TaxID=72559 RepID=A0A2N8UI84_9BASI|nr:uncharacterized protein SRS1_14797 [Sporisorium reilianum f. sp. reilianum]
MITDLILLLVLFALLFGLVKLVSLVQPPPPTKTTTAGSAGTPSTPSSSTTSFGNNTIDWHTGQLNVKSSMRPVTQQDLLDKAAAAGADGGRFVAKHAESFSFANKKDS